MRTLVVNSASIPFSSNDDMIFEILTASDDMVIGAVWQLFELSLLVSKYKHCKQSLKAPDGVLKLVYHNTGVFRKQTMLNSAFIKVEEHVTTGLHQLQKQRIPTIFAAIIVRVYGLQRLPHQNLGNCGCA